MCNCGNKREEFTARQAPSSHTAIPRKPVTAKTWPDVAFEYTGNSALNVTGNITGKHYRFTKKGDRQPVDYRDARSMMNVPVLKKH